MVVGELQQSFLVDTRWLHKLLDLAAPSRDDVVFLVGGGNGQLASALGSASRVVTVEPDESIANYLYSLEIYKNMVIHADPGLTLGDIPFDQLLCLQPEHVHEGMLAGMLRVPFRQAVMLVPEPVTASFRSRDMLGTLLRAAFDVEVLQRVPKNAFSPMLEHPSSLVRITPSSKSEPVSAALRLMMREVGTMRGLLTRSCREFFGYTLADAQEAVRLLDAELLKKRFWELSEEEFKAVHAWLRLG